MSDSRLLKAVKSMCCLCLAIVHNGRPCSMDSREHSWASNERRNCRWLVSAEWQTGWGKGRHNQPCSLIYSMYIAHTHTHIHLTALCPGLPRWASTRKVKPIWILLRQETVSGSGISWAICKFAPASRQITVPASHHSVFLHAGCPSCHPTNSVRAL